MTPSELREARLQLGLSHSQMASLLGYQNADLRQMGYKLEVGSRTIRDPQRRLVEAYLSGYRPADWPVIRHRLAVDAG